MPINVYTANAWSRLRDAFDLKGKHQLQLDEVIVPVAIVADLASETTNVRNDATLFIAVPAAGVGDTGKALLQNTSPTFELGTATILLDRIYFSSTTTGQWNFHATTIAPLTPIAASTIIKQWNDPTQVSVPAGSGFADEGAFGTGKIMQLRLNAAAALYWIEPKWVLQPGQNFVVQHASTNIGFEVTFQYRVVALG